MSEDKGYNPFAGMDNITSAEDILAALIEKATHDGDIRPLGGAMGMMQKQIEGIGMHLGQTLEALRTEVGHMGMMNDVARLTTGLLITILIEKEVITQEEFDTLYKEKVIDVMESHMKKLQEEQEKAQQEQEQRIKEFAEMAANQGEILDPNTGEAVSLAPNEEPEEVAGESKANCEECKCCEDSTPVADKLAEFVSEVEEEIAGEKDDG